MKSEKKSKQTTAINLDALADKSIKLLDDHITETYAGLLAKQNKIDKAIEAYHKLSLKFPEKSSYFAKIINDLKNK
ncbi:MAG: hypothetical protein EA412_02430 [Chitinophagaceae bacterium]|nr:MAG: hypothetical protein EA412_02430 [Chitinophagaceae bacterium]